MPVHDWTRVAAGDFHDFHQGWTIALRNALNAGVLPDEFYAMAEQYVGGPVPDVITLHRPAAGVGTGPGGRAIADKPPRVRFRYQAEIDAYVRRANRIAIRHRGGEVVAVIEVVSPGNKGSVGAFRAFVQKACDLIGNGIHLLVVDLFPPTPRDPQGVHGAIWGELVSQEFELPPDKPLTLASYCVGEARTAYVEPVAVGDVMPDMPVFLTPEVYVEVPLESTYMATWEVYPRPLKELLVG